MSEPLLPLAGLLGGAAVASGLRIYATVAVLGFLGRQGIVHLPAGLAVIENPWIIGLASLLYLVEFVADKVPAIDSAWDAVHTFVRAPAAGLLAWAATGDVAEPWRFGAALLCGTVALGAHGLKSGARLAVNASPEPFSNWGLSFAEELSVAGLLWIAIAHPIAAIAAATVVLIAATALVAWLVRSLRGLLRRAATRPA